MLNELQRQTKHNPRGGRASEAACDIYGLHTNYRAHTGDVYDAAAMSKLPEKLELKTKQATQLLDKFWVSAKHER